ncbi:ArsR/SmtB family transcription factor [Saccharomonospora azurea]|uniref:ArsR/SmtB family transcription factor n=1 Tax=Saccharomonospora azurea TaxID=40988 RepID=UPI003D8A25B2
MSKQQFPVADTGEPYVTQGMGEPLTAKQAVDLARAFKAIGDPVRLRLLSLIASHVDGEACVCDVAGAFELAGPTISHHLKVLRKADLIEGERRGTWIYYRVRPEALRLLAESLLLLAESQRSAVGVPA